MFSRFRNLFAKAKSENSPEPEPEPEPETVNATANGQAQTNGGNEQTKLENENIAQVNIVNTTEEGNTVKEEEDEENEQPIDSAAKVVLSEITQQNVHPSNGQVTQALSTVIVENALTTTEINSAACDNENEVGEESINTAMIENEKASGQDVKATDSVRVGEVGSEEQERVEENAPTTNGSAVVELVKVDTARHIEVNTQSAEEVVVVEKTNENGNNVNESAGVLPLLGEVAQNETDAENIVSPITLNNDINNATEAEATPATEIENENSLDQIIESTTLANVNEVTQIPFSSITVDELATDTSSPAVDRLTQSSSSPAGTVGSDSTVDSNTIVIKPTGNNDIACMAISNKLQEIAEVAESLDAAIRDVQQDAEALEVQVPSTAEKKREAMRSISSEDWHSRSTEDDSFVTASEGNFTPHSHSSSYQTASGRTSSYISSVKSSFDVSEADDSTFASTYDIPVDLNMSYDGSEHSFVSAQQQQPDATSSPHERELAANDEESCADGAYALPNTTAEQQIDDEGSSIADIEELHSQSVTPTPGDGDVEQFHCQSIPVESETEELDSSSTGIVDAPTLQVLTEMVPVTSVTPEVSTCSSTDQQQKLEQQQLSMAQQQQTHANNNNTNTNNNNNNNNTNNSNSNTTTTANNQKPNAAWRRSKYYENITKQTIKGFL